jgi:hypothetical protein
MDAREVVVQEIQRVRGDVFSNLTTPGLFQRASDEIPQFVAMRFADPYERV